MLTRKIGMKRMTFVAVVSAVERSIGHPNIAEINRARAILHFACVWTRTFGRIERV
jgi:hypothetical protein